MRKSDVKVKKYLFGVIASVLVMSFFTVGMSTNLFKANSFMNIEHAAFDGTVYPYMAVPNWSQLSDAQRLLTFDKLPSDLLLAPLRYRAGDLARTFESLGFSDSDQELRNEKITYSVPYMGNYKLDGKENVGSHAAVDIKLPIGTPILSIANGVVIKAENQETGFGKHVVVRHSNMPSLTDPNAKETYFSSYSHMSSFSVVPGDIVKKGQVIGKVGDTGTATTPHIHFQIDTVDAPFHPYWPFSSAEANAAGLSFFEALNSGLGKENALKRTVHPLEYVQKYLNTSGSAQEGISKDTAENNIIVETENNEEEDVNTAIVGNLTLDAPEKMVLGKTYMIKVKYGADHGSMLASVGADDFAFTPSLRASFIVPRATGFTGDEVTIPFTPKETGSLSLKVKVDSVKTYATDIEVVLFNDIPTTHPDYSALESLKSRGIIEGYEDGSFRPEQKVARVEALKFLALSVDPQPKMYLDDLPFADIELDSWYDMYLRQAVEMKAVSLDNDEFMPSREVNRAEFLKMLYEAKNVDLADYQGGEWFNRYMKVAKADGVIKADDLPSDSLSRLDIVKIVYAFLNR